MNNDQFHHQLAAALRAAEDQGLPAAQRADMLVEIAIGMQMRPRSPADLHSAIDLYERALALCAAGDALGRARILARKATALQALPGEDSTSLEAARSLLVAAREVFDTQATASELAELQMNLGLVEQALAGFGRGSMPAAIRAYQQALRTFTAADYPREYAILHNNLATAFLSLQTGDPQGRMREALAVQSFEAALEHITIEAHPQEYAMLQNNLGNALQQVDSAHPLDNLLRAVEAYDEALRVRTAEQMPVQYANTLANRAACLAALPPGDLDGRDPHREALACYREAALLFDGQHESDRARLVREALQALENDLARPAGASAEP